MIFKKAFTMIELVLVIVAVGIISGIAIPKLQNYRFDADLALVQATYESVSSKTKAMLLDSMMTGNIDKENPLGYVKDGDRYIIFTNIFKKGLEAQSNCNKISKGWCTTDGETNFTFKLNSSNSYNFTYDKKGNFICSSSNGAKLKKSLAILCDLVN